MRAQPEPGKVLGMGCFRLVLEYGPYLVLKIDHPVPSPLVERSASRRGRHAGSANRREWLVWTRVRKTPLAPYFAAAKELLEDGRLVMERGTRSARKCPSAARMAALAVALDLYDGSEGNLGRVRGRLKFVDYQMVDLRRLTTGIKMVEAWRSGATAQARA
jgi:hypothetical protein